MPSKLKKYFVEEQKEKEKKAYANCKEKLLIKYIK